MKVIKLMAGYSLLTRFLLFISVFSTIWLFLEPLALFKLFQQELESLGMKGYLLLVFFSFIITILIEVIHVQIKLKGADMMYFYITLSSIGKKHKFYTSRYFSVEEFLKTYKEFVQKSNTESNQLLFLFDHYKPNLFVVKNNLKVELNSQKTFEELAINEGDQLIIKGEIIKRSFVFMTAPSSSIRKSLRLLNIQWGSLIYGKFWFFEKFNKKISSSEQSIRE